MESTHTIRVDEYRKSSTSDTAGLEYKGLRIHALPGLHDYTYAALRRHSQAGESVLDLAAGSGAMSLRLHDGGYQVTATDYVAESFRLKDQIPFFQANLNEDVSVGREESFDIIVASEIIEHLENPRHFARQAFRMLKPGGRVLLSTPNVDSPASLVKFMRDGTFQWFGEHDYQRFGHISPLTQWQLDKCFSEAGFTFLWRGSYGEKFAGVSASPRLLLLAKLIDRLMPHAELKNQIFVAILQKPH